MEKRIEDIFAGAPKVSLTADEKSAGREMLRSLIALRPLRPRAGWSFGLSRSFTLATAAKPAAVFATVLGLTLSAAGVSYAAEGTVPGDALYPVKVAVNENVRAAFAATPKDKAEWEAERAERRLAEAETLAKRGQLKASTSAQLAADFRLHADNAQHDMADLRAVSDDDAAADVGAHLEGALQAHKKILAELHADASAAVQAPATQDGAKDVQGDGSGKDDVQPIAAIAATVDTEAASALKERKSAEDDVAKEKDQNRARKSVEARRAAAEKKIADARSFLVDVRAPIGADAAAQVEGSLIAAEGAVAKGDAAAAAGDDRGAFSAYLAAQRGAQEAMLLMKAKQGLRLKMDLGVTAGGDDAKDDGGDGQTNDLPGAQAPDHAGDSRPQGASGRIDARRTGGGEDGGDLRARIDGSLRLR